VLLQKRVQAPSAGVSGGNLSSICSYPSSRP
jgi:hypothetical protein